MALVSITSSLVLFSFFYRSPVKVIEMGNIRVPTIKPLGCVRTKEILEVSTFVCIKPEKEDRIISDSLLYTGIWEEGIVTNVLKALKLYPDAVFLDLGANIGVYSLLVAQLRHSSSDYRPERVVAVDAAGDNLEYIRKSLINNKISRPLVTLVHNAISNVSEPLYPVNPKDYHTNPGTLEFLRKEDIGKQEVLGPPTSSITMKNLLEAIPPATLIVKMDIQGHECHALRSLGRFPTSHPMPYIFMEWGEVHERCPNLASFIDFMKGEGYMPRWPENLAKMTDHCLHSPKNDVLWVHKFARPIWEEAKDKMVECAFDPEWQIKGPLKHLKHDLEFNI